MATSSAGKMYLSKNANSSAPDPSAPSTRSLSSSSMTVSSDFVLPRPSKMAASFTSNGNIVLMSLEQRPWRKRLRSAPVSCVTAGFQRATKG